MLWHIAKLNHSCKWREKDRQISSRQSTLTYKKVELTVLNRIFSGFMIVPEKNQNNTEEKSAISWVWQRLHNIHEFGFTSLLKLLFLITLEIINGTQEFADLKLKQFLSATVYFTKQKRCIHLYDHQNPSKGPYYHKLSSSHSLPHILHLSHLTSLLPLEKKSLYNSLYKSKATNTNFYDGSSILEICSFLTCH